MFILATFRILSFRTLPFIPQKKIRIKFSANYPLTTFRNPHSAKYPFPSTSIYGRRCKTPQCAHLSCHFCTSSTSVNLIRILICCRFRSGKSYITSWCIQNLSKRALNRQTVSTSTTELGSLLQMLTKLMNVY